MDNFCRCLPKVELHAHLSGSLSRQTINKLVDLGIDQCAEYKGLSASEKNAIVIDTPKNMQEVFKIFPIIQSLTKTKEAVSLATSCVISEFAEDGTCYLELRSTPKETSAMSREEYVGAILSAISSHPTRIVTRLLLSIDRRQSVEEAMSTADMAIRDTSGLIVGIELSGNPSLDGRKFIPILEKARRFGLRVSTHLAEVPDNMDEVHDFLSFCPDRIGHGTFLHFNKEYECSVIEKKIPIEVCLSSNVLSKTTASVADSHIKHWLSLDHPVSINTDDKGMMGQCSLSSEYQLAMETFDLSREKMKEIALSSLQQSFLDHSSRDYSNLYELISTFSY